MIFTYTDPLTKLCLRRVELFFTFQINFKNYPQEIQTQGNSVVTTEFLINKRIGFIPINEHLSYGLTRFINIKKILFFSSSLNYSFY